MRAYPRRCGEHRTVETINAALLGLPPQVRGARHAIRRGNSGHRLTPAGAGSTNPLTAGAGDPGAYPRRCGEHHEPVPQLLRDRGLPPQVRGALQRELRGSDGTRLTPAGAGSTHRRPIWPLSRRAYPRRCGEHRTVETINAALLGLPPQVRGAHRYYDTFIPGAGLTPAGAGSTPRGSGSTR